MALSNAQLQARVEAIEEKLNEIQTALLNITTAAQLKASQLVRQKEIEQLKTRVTSLESQIVALQTLHT